ncbi:MAG: ABC transporter substrate-binding protein [Gammaproteobacteria bacterium]|nr:ABC transporter substrate-binding protein [Gammaproteobacteria bacterium]
MKKFLTLLLVLLVAPVMASTGPELLIRETSEKVLDEIKTNAKKYASDPQSIYKLVDEVVLPHFDFESMTDLALGRYKDEVDSEQRPAIIREFRLLLVRTYSLALLEYTDQGMIYLPMEGVEADGEVTVRTEIEQAGGFPIPINYMLRLGDDGWKVIDISVDDVSLVTNYRSSFARAIKKDGVDGLIETLRDRNQSQ